MFEYALIAVFGLAAGAMILDFAKDDDDSADDPEGEAGAAITVPVGGSAEGTPGDDTITGTTARQVLGGDGDDVIRVDNLADGLADGGAGDDLLHIAHGSNATISGGDGDDTLIGGAGETMTFYGGAGDDLLELDVSRAYVEGQYVTIDAGAGDDRLSLSIGYHDSATLTQPVATGGTGADIFDLSLAPMPDRAPSEDDDFADGAEIVLTITDFTPGDDQLAITLPAQSALAYNGATLLSENGATSITLSYDQLTEQGHIVEARAMIRLIGVTDLQLSDIRIMTAAT